MFDHGMTENSMTMAMGWMNAEAAEHVLEWGGGTGVRGHLTY